MAKTSSSAQCKAIEVLLDSPTVPDAARVLGMAAKKLYRWLANPVFAAEYEAATRAAHNHQMARLRQGATLAVRSTIQIMHQGKPADRLKAARLLIRLAEDDREIREFEETVEKLERAALTAAESPSRREPARPLRTGHGAKSSALRKQAIAALLEERTLAAAAQVSGAGVQTLCRWLHQPAFQAALAGAVREVWGEAMMFVRKYMGQAITTQRNFMIDPAVPDGIKLQAVSGTVREGNADQMAALRERLAKLDSAGSEAEPGKTVERSLYRRVQRLKAGLRQAAGPVMMAPTFVHAVDGRPGGTSVRGPDGRHVWLDPPPGCQAGDAVEEEAA